MENYISPNLIESEFEIDLSSYKDNWSEIDVPKILVGKTMTQIKDETVREKKIKIRLNKSVAKKINKDYLEEIDAYEDIKQWFLKIKKINEMQN